MSSAPTEYKIHLADPNHTTTINPYSDSNSNPIPHIKIRNYNIVNKSRVAYSMPNNILTTSRGTTEMKTTGARQMRTELPPFQQIIVILC